MRRFGIGLVPLWKRTVVGSVARHTRGGESLTHLVTVISATVRQRGIAVDRLHRLQNSLTFADVAPEELTHADTLHAAVQELAAGVGIGSPQSSPARWHRWQRRPT